MSKNTIFFIVLLMSFFIAQCYGKATTVFVALELPQDLINTIKNTQTQIKNLVPEFVLQDEKDLHVTLHFIKAGGDIDSDQEKKLKIALENAAQRIYSFDITSNVNAGIFQYFPKNKQIVLKLNPVPNSLQNLFDLLKKKMNNQGASYTTIEPYLPHITIGISKDSNILSKIKNLAKPQTNQFIVDKFFLKKRTSQDKPWFENYGEYGFLPSPKTFDLKSLQDDLENLEESLKNLNQKLP